MPVQIKFLHLLILLIFIQILGCASLPQKDFRNIPGINYEAIVTKANQVAHVATIDQNYFHVKFFRAQTKSGLEKPSIIAKQKNAIIAINGGFFTKEGKPAGALKINSNWLAYPSKLRGALGLLTKPPPD